jgi:hypothetical protein
MILSSSYIHVQKEELFHLSSKSFFSPPIDWVPDYIIPVFIKFKLFCRLWYDSYQGRTCCILGGYALMRRIKSLRTVTLSRLMLYNGLLFGRLSLFIVSCLLTSISPTSNHRNFKKDKFNCYPSCLFSLIFNWCFYLYDRLLFVEIIYS